MSLGLFAALPRSAARAVVPRLLNRIPVRAMATAPEAKRLRVLRYEFVEGMVEKRKPFREAHLQLAADKEKEGKVILCGALGETATGGLFIWNDTPVEEIEAFAKGDPYVVNGLVTNWTVELFNVVHGTLKESV